MPKPLNVLFLIIDSLRYDRTGTGGHRPSPTPYMDSLMRQNLSLEWCIACGSPTDFAYPGLTTGTLPLDRGGYTNGIETREMTVAEAFRDAGYETAAFFPDYFKTTACYQRGFDYCHNLFGLVRGLVDTKDNLKFYAELYANDSRPEARERCRAASAAYMRTLLSDLAAYTESIVARDPDSDLGQSLLFQGIDFVAMRAELKAELVTLERDPEAYVEPILQDQPGPFVRHLWDQVHARAANLPASSIDRRVNHLRLLVLAELAVLYPLGRVHKRGVTEALKLKREPASSALRYTTTDMARRCVMDWIDKRQTEKPFFTWMHVSDVHEQNFVSSDLADEPVQLDAELATARRHLRKIATRLPLFHGTPSYDLAVRYTDTVVERLVADLEARSLRENTLLVITADHGHQFPEWPRRQAIHVARSFYDDIYHIPAVFVHPSLGADSRTGLYSSVDLPATMLDLAGVPVPSCFVGRSVRDLPAHGRDHVISEHNGQGPCDLTHKSIFVVARNKQAKIVLEAWQPAHDRPANIREVYDLTADPRELHNLAGSAPLLPAAAPLLQIAHDRIASIYEQAAHLAQ